MNENIVVKENELTAEDFCLLIDKVGWGTLDVETIRTALANSLYLISIKIDGQTIGMGRVIGDGVRIFYLQDIVIDPEHQGKGYGKLIVEKLLKYIQINKPLNAFTMIYLIAAKGKEPFYESLGFESCPNDIRGCAMRYIG